MEPDEIITRLEQLVVSAQSQNRAQNYDEVIHLTREVKLDAAHLLALHEKELSKNDRLRVEDCIFTAYKLRCQSFKSLARKTNLPLVGRYYNLRAGMVIEAAYHRFKKVIAKKDRPDPAGWPELKRLLGQR